MSQFGLRFEWTCLDKIVGIDVDHWSRLMKNICDFFYVDPWDKMFLIRKKNFLML